MKIVMKGFEEGHANLEVELLPLPELSPHAQTLVEKHPGLLSAATHHLVDAYARVGRWFHPHHAESAARNIANSATYLLTDESGQLVSAENWLETFRQHLLSSIVDRTRLVDYELII